METTPSSTRRITRSQTRVASTKNNSLTSSRQTEEPDKSTLISEQMSAKKKQQQDRTALIDITNDSPIVGVAMGNLETPSSKRVMNSQARCLCTPGSGEALLRGQVKTLLQKVEEEAVLQKITLDTRPFFNLQGLVNSPIKLLAPTPANTPQVLNFSDANDCVLPCVTQEILIPETALDQKTSQETTESSENGITRSLLLDFSEKSDSSDCTSALTYEGIAFSRECGSSGEKVYRDEEDDDSSSVWSIQANASSTRDNDYEVVEEEHCDDEEEEYYVYEDEEEDYDHNENTDGLHLDGLCGGLSKVNVCGDDDVAKFTGKRIRFVYNSDDELQGQEEVGSMQQ